MPQRTCNSHKSCTCQVFASSGTQQKSFSINCRGQCWSHAQTNQSQLVKVLRIQYGVHQIHPHKQHNIRVSFPHLFVGWHKTDQHSQNRRNNLQELSIILLCERHKNKNKHSCATVHTCWHRMLRTRLIPASRKGAAKVNIKVGRIERLFPLGFLSSTWLFQCLFQVSMTLRHVYSGLISYRSSSVIGFFQPFLMILSNQANTIWLG